MTYQEKLKDPRWQKKRLEILDRDGWECKECGNDKKTLHIHHKFYEKGKDPWEYENDMLVTLCGECHEEESYTIYHISQNLLKQIRRNFSSNNITPISQGFNELELTKSPEFTASLIHWVLTNKSLMKELDSRYLKSLSEARSKKG